MFVRVNTGATENAGMENARQWKSDGGKPETDTHYLGIVIPNPGIPDVFLNPESRDWQSPNPGISGLKKFVFVS